MKLNIFKIIALIIVVFFVYNCGGKYEPNIKPESYEINNNKRENKKLENQKEIEQIDDIEMVKIPKKAVMEKKSYFQRGIASWYGGKFHGRRTANGEVYDKYKLTAAHKTLPFNSIVEVTNLENDKKVLVRINDRGPFVKNRIIDLSKKAARLIGIEETGTAPVILNVINNKSLNKTDMQYSKNELMEKTDLNQSSQFEQWFYIQAGAFKDKENANKLIKKIQRATDVVFLIKNRNGLYKVISVRLSPRSFADKISSNLKEYNIDCFVKSF